MASEEDSKEENLNISTAKAPFREIDLTGVAQFASTMKNYTLIITEKPDTARRIALALDRNQDAKRINEKGVSYYLARRDKDIVVVPALGHLYTVAADKKGRSSYPVFSFKWVPRFIAEKRAAHVRAWLEVIMKLARNADGFVDACDYDLEGSVIGYCILKYACGGREKTSRRMRFSTLTREELEKAYVESLPHLDFALIEAGMTRHEVDWLYGINLSRALTYAARNWSGKYRTLSTGRVQGPLLKFLVLRERAIRSFVPAPYWQIRALLEINGQTFWAEYVKRVVENKKQAYAVSQECKGTGRVEKVIVRRFQHPAPVPFDLGALQVEAYRFFGYNPKRTLDIAQSLYLNALISYPRTSSQKLPPAIDFESILTKLGNLKEYRELVSGLLAEPVLKPCEGSKKDPAHPAIYPTGKLPEPHLNRSARNIWDLIVRRFMAVFGEPAIEQSVEADISVNSHIFCLKGRQTEQQGWQKFYVPYVKSEEILLPLLNKGQPVGFKKVVVETKFTRPPQRYNPCSLLQKMEEAGIGTKATRADTAQTLYEREYIQNEKMKVTDLGFEVFEVLRNYCRQVVSVEMTRELEERIDRISQDCEKRKDVLAGTIRILRPVLKELKQEELVIGERLRNAVEKTKLEENFIGECPNCRTGKLLVIYSRKTGKRFIGCTNYFKGLCNSSFALPQNGTISLDNRKCTACGWPTVHFRTRGKRWSLCFNPGCAMKEGKRRDKN